MSPAILRSTATIISKARTAPVGQRLSTRSLTSILEDPTIIDDTIRFRQIRSYGKKALDPTIIDSPMGVAQIRSFSSYLNDPTIIDAPISKGVNSIIVNDPTIIDCPFNLSGILSDPTIIDNQL